ncbi:hypothetical protein GCM10025875_25250 [Litorihabitans aurantiacus]|uniref:DUF898 family protein n=1 Tax=Litorihabitans aurantiacus TaxID=1930061 RepID=A0AA37XFN7_9MICO|nr:hypothetical protein GCM10025875_25250 [Litorihabitans aurantiacus]
MTSPVPHSAPVTPAPVTPAPVTSGHQTIQIPLGVPMYRFDGGAATYFGASLAAALATILTLGICLPWAVVILQRWHTKHTFLDGRRLRFTGTAPSLFGQWIKWWLLTLITIGIYSFWVYPRMTAWVVQHQEFDRSADRSRAHERHSSARWAAAGEHGPVGSTAAGPARPAPPAHPTEHPAPSPCGRVGSRGAPPRPCRHRRSKHSPPTSQVPVPHGEATLESSATPSPADAGGARPR